MSNGANPTRLLYSVRDAADQLSVSDYEIRKAIQAGELEAVKQGRRVLIPHAALVAYTDRMPRYGETA